MSAITADDVAAIAGDVFASMVDGEQGTLAPWPDGVPVAMFEARTGLPRAAIAGKLALAHDRGWLEPDPDWLRPTELGRRFANDVIGLFLD